MNLTIYGDFNCPYSYLASIRADVLIAAGLAQVEWKAVEHSPEIPSPSGAPSDAEEASLDREIDEIRRLIGPEEYVPLSRPPLLPNSAAAIARFAAAPAAQADEIRRRLFTALWADGRDIDDEAVLHALVGRVHGSDRGRDAWQREWLAFDERIVPTMVLDDGQTSPGIGALKRLADFAGSSAPPP